MELEGLNINTNEIEKLLQRQIEILESMQPDEISEEEQEKIEKELQEEKKKKEELEKKQIEFIESSMTSQNTEIEQLEILAEQMEQLNENIIELQKSNVEGFWFIGLAVIITLAVKFFAEQIFKW